MTATVLVLVETINDYLPILEHQGFHLILAPTPAERAETIAQHGAQIDAVLTRGPLGLHAEEIAALPNLKIICVIGAGYEEVDLAAAAARRITVTNGAGANAVAVADHALALLFAVVRDIARADASTRLGQWNRVISPSISGKRLGILGLGAAGLAIARRAAQVGGEPFLGQVHPVGQALLPGLALGRLRIGPRRRLRRQSRHQRRCERGAAQLRRAAPGAAITPREQPPFHSFSFSE